MSILENEIQALRVKQSRIEAKQRKENAEVWNRINTLEKLALEKTGVDAGKLSPSVQIAANKMIQKRGLKYLPK